MGSIDGAVVPRDEKKVLRKGGNCVQCEFLIVRTLCIGFLEHKGLYIIIMALSTVRLSNNNETVKIFVFNRHL